MTITTALGQQKIRGVTLALGGAFPLVAMITIMPVMPQMTAHYASTPGGTVLTGLVLVVTPLAAAVGSPFIGRMVDRFGGMRAYIAAVLVFGLCGGLGYFVAPLNGLIATRIMVGFGMAGMSAATGALFAQLFADKAREGWLAVQTALMSLGSILFAPLAGLVAEGDWRRVFLIVPLALLLVPMILISRFSSAPARSTAIAVGDETSFPFKKIILISAVNFGCLVACFGQVLPVGFLIAERGYHSTTLTGFAIAVNAIGGAVGSAGFGFFPTKPIATRLRIGLATALIAYVALLIPGWAGVFGAQFAIGMAVGFLLPALVVWAISSVSADQGGRSVGMIMTATFLSQFGGMPLAALAASRLGSFNTGMTVFAGLIAVGLMMTFIVKTDRNRSD